MIEPVQQAESIPVPNSDRSYSPDHVAWWLENWAVLKELALLTPRSTSRFREILICGKGSAPRDPMRYVHTICDLTVAWGLLEPGSLEYYSVEAMVVGSTFRQAEHDRHRRHGTIAAAYPRACRQMAERLGWCSDHQPLDSGDTSALELGQVQLSQQAGVSS